MILKFGDVLLVGLQHIPSFPLCRFLNFLLIQWRAFSREHDGLESGQTLISIFGRFRLNLILTLIIGSSSSGGHTLVIDVVVPG